VGIEHWKYDKGRKNAESHGNQEMDNMDANEGSTATERYCDSRLFSWMMCPRKAWKFRMDHFSMIGERDIGNWDKPINELEVLNTKARAEQMESVVWSMGQQLNWNPFDPCHLRRSSKRKQKTDGDIVQQKNLRDRCHPDGGLEGV
jgi:hypothetical protein